MSYVRALMGYLTYLDAPKDLQESWLSSFHLVPPKFVVETCFSEQQLAMMMRKMQALWMALGASFGVLIAPCKQAVYVCGASDVTKHPIDEPFKHRLLTGFEGDFGGYTGC